MQIPEVRKYRDYRAFLRDFLATNQGENGRFSLRSFGDGIGWPHALLRDIIHGTKRLTVLRAIEFSKFVALNAIDTEWLVNLALADSEEVAVSRYFRRLNVRGIDELHHSDALQESVIFRDAQTFAVYCLLASCQRLPDADTVAQTLFTFNLDPKTVTHIIERLRADDLIDVTNGRVSVIDNKAFFAENPAPGSSRLKSAIDLHRQFIANLSRYCDRFDSKAPSQLTGGYVLLTEEQFREAKEKMLRWVHGVEQHSGELFGTPTDAADLAGSGRNLYQFYLALVPILRMPT